jgi:protein arginine N-methyltransferase 1
MERLIVAVLGAVHRVLRRIWRFAKQDERLQSITYRLRNSRAFSDVSQHERMLADHVRVETYHAAIKKHVSEGDIVVDLGTGTGILAFFAGQQRAKQVYALDHSSIIELAEKIGEANGLKNVSFLRMHSSQFAPPEKVDVIIHEQIGDALLNEDMVRNICELRDKVLAPGGIILPGKFELFVEPARLKETLRVPFLWENDIHGIRYDVSQNWVRANVENPPQSRRITPEDVAEFLCEPQSVLSIDLLTARPDDVPRQIAFRKVAAKSGFMDGYCLYFDVLFDSELSLSTSPFAERTHWNCQIFRTERLFVQEGDEFEVTFDIPNVRDVTTWRVRHTLVPRRIDPAPHASAPQLEGAQ